MREIYGYAAQGGQRMIRPQEIVLMVLVTIWFSLSLYNFMLKEDKTTGIYFMLIAIFMLLALK